MIFNQVLQFFNDKHVMLFCNWSHVILTLNHLRTIWFKTILILIRLSPDPGALSPLLAYSPITKKSSVQEKLMIFARR